MNIKYFYKVEIYIWKNSEHKWRGDDIEDDDETGRSTEEVAGGDDNDCDYDACPHPALPKWCHDRQVLVMTMII